jgi:rRNA-processing protein FCF1
MGRIADIAEAGFIDGMMVVPEFVLRELQIVADSTDGSKRQRGRRGLDMLQRMQSNTNIQVQIVPDDFPSIREVDLKLLELAKKWEAKVVTNDFNLNKVAHLHRVEVLNINDLANALEARGAARREDECAHPERRERVQPGRGLPGRWDDGGGGSRAADDRQASGDFRDQRAANGQREDDLRQAGGSDQAGRGGAAGGDDALSNCGRADYS